MKKVRSDKNVGKRRERIGEGLRAAAKTALLVGSERARDDRHEKMRTHIAEGVDRLSKRRDDTAVELVYALATGQPITNWELSAIRLRIKNATVRKILGHLEHAMGMGGGFADLDLLRTIEKSLSSLVRPRAASDGAPQTPANKLARHFIAIIGEERAEGGKEPSLRAARSILRNLERWRRNGEINPKKIPTGIDPASVVRDDAHAMVRAAYEAVGLPEPFARDRKQRSRKHAKKKIERQRQRASSAVTSEHLSQS